MGTRLIEYRGGYVTGGARPVEAKLKLIVLLANECAAPVVIFEFSPPTELSSVTAAGFEMHGSIGLTGGNLDLQADRGGWLFPPEARRPGWNWDTVNLKGQSSDGGLTFRGTVLTLSGPPGTFVLRRVYDPVDGDG